MATDKNKKDKKPKPIGFNKRRWLNKKNHHSVGFTFVEAEGLEGNYPWIHLIIGDCSRTITLDFTEGGEPDDDKIQNSYTKLERLRDTLDDVERAIGIMEVETRKRKRKKQKKKTTEQ